MGRWSVGECAAGARAGAGVANLKVAGHQPLLNNALERLLGKGRPQIIQVAKDTLEGNLRGVLSQLTPEEVNQDKLRFAEKLLEEAEHDLSRLGLVLDVLKVQNVSDDVGYLNSLGRKQTAALDKSARVAEAEAHAEATMREAENGLAARLSLIEAEAAIARAEADKRIMQCETGREAMVAEAVGKVTTAIARAEAELKVQQARLPQVRLQLEADVVAPARADMEKRQAEARGKAAKIVEDGKATAAVLTQMIEAWKAAGPNARDILLMQKLQTVMSSLVETIQNVSVDRVSYLPATPQVTQGIQLVEQVKAAFGVDLAKVVAQLGAPGGATPAHLAAASVASSPTLPANASDGTAAPSTRPRT